jgi:hypothetical protein
VYTIRYFLLNPANQKLHHGSQTGRSQRVPFIAAAEIMEVDTEARLTARTDLSQGGCCLDMVNPLPQGTSVKLAIAQGSHLWRHRDGVYSQTPLGMGGEFREIDSTHWPRLGQWLYESSISVPIMHLRICCKPLCKEGGHS